MREVKAISTSDKASVFSIVVPVLLGSGCWPLAAVKLVDWVYQNRGHVKDKVGVEVKLPKK